MADTSTTIITSNYATTVPGILKIVEAVLSLAAFICAVIPYAWTSIGGGWVQFVTITAFICVLVIFCLYIFMYSRLPNVFPLGVLIFYVVYDVFYFISGILTAVRAGQFRGYVPAISACAFFCFVALIVFIIDTIMQFQAWRITRTSGGTTHSTSSTTSKTTHTVVTVG